jgi:hypothetical protein
VKGLMEKGVQQQIWTPKNVAAMMDYNRHQMYIKV